MSRYQAQVRPAPSGMNTQADLPVLPIERSRYIKGFLPARAGKLYLSHLLNNLNGVNNGMRIIGHAWYSDGRPPTSAEYAAGIQRRSRLIVWYVAGQMRVYNIFMGGRWPYCRADHIADLQDPGPQMEREYPVGHDELWMNRQIRWVQLNDELFWCRSDGSKIRRIYQDAEGRMHQYMAGIDAPDEDALSPQDDYGRISTTPCYYAITWADEKFRESNYTSVEAEFSAEAGNYITITWPDDPQVKYAYVYRSATGTTDFYRIQVYITPDETTLHDYVERVPRVATVKVLDKTAESDLVLGQTAPEIGANAPPNPASILTIHGRRLIANDRSLNYGIGEDCNRTDVESVCRVQISNLDAPTQFNVAEASLSDHGTQLTVGTNFEDEVSGLHSIGAMLGIWTRRSRYVLYGDSIEDWTLKYIDTVGCVAPASIAELDNAIMWLSDDGVYAVGYDSGLAATCISREIDQMFTGYASGSLFAGGIVSE